MEYNEMPVEELKKELGEMTMLHVLAQYKAELRESNWYIKSKFIRKAETQTRCFWPFGKEYPDTKTRCYYEKDLTHEIERAANELIKRLNEEKK